MMTCTSQSLRAAFYARVSSDQQAQAGTIASQVEALQQRITQDGLTREEELCFVDDGYSGSTLIRPGLERLRDQAAAGAMDRLYVHSPDRLARRYAYQALLTDELQGCGVELIFLNRPPGKGPEEELVLQVQGVIAEYERAKILERSRRGKLHAARRGSVSVLTRAPYGYRYVGKSVAGAEAHWTIQLEEARVIRDIFEGVGVHRLSLSEVARRLGKQGISSPCGRRDWDRSTLWSILKNPAYKGSAAYGKTRVGERRFRPRPQRNQPEQPRRAVSLYPVPSEEWIHIPVPAIIDESLFNAVQDQLAENRERHRRRQVGRYLLQGLVVCKICGYAMCGRLTPRANIYYRCSGNQTRRGPGVRGCRNPSVRADRLEEAVWHDVCNLLADPHRLEEEYQRRLHLDKEAAGNPDDRRRKTQVNQVRRQIARLIDAYAEGLIGKDEFEPRIQIARARLAQLEAEVQSQAAREAELREIRLVIGHLQTFAERVREGLDHADNAVRRDIVQTLVKRVEVTHEEVRVIYRVACRPVAQGPKQGSWQHCWRRACPCSPHLERGKHWRASRQWHPSRVVAPRFMRCTLGDAGACPLSGRPTTIRR